MIVPRNSVVAGANALWLMSQSLEYRRFLNACDNIRGAQEEKLSGYLRRNAGTAFGKAHGFAKLKGPREYAKNIPLQNWEIIKPWVERTACGEANILSASPITRLEPTSGTSAEPKYIPANGDRRTEISRTLAAWMCALFRQVPAAFAGTAYWSLSPPGMSPVPWPGAQLPIGHARDTEYLDPFSAFLMRRIFAVPESLVSLSDPMEFYRQTMLRLLADNGLSFVSVWSPTFLLLLDSRLREGRDDLTRQLAHLGWASKSRLRHLEHTLGTGFTWREIWPKLAVVSCWTHAQSALFTEKIRSVLGPIYLQPKGLMSTEGTTTLPLRNDCDPCLAVRSHYFEFLPESTARLETGLQNEAETLQSHELEIGYRYEVVLTTGGGLYRYRTGDLVQVTGFFRQCPNLLFLGRTGRVSDLAGEKVTEIQANEALSRMQNLRLEVQCAFLYPRVEEMGAICYQLFLLPLNGCLLDPVSINRAAVEVETILLGNPYYQQARALGQLRSVSVRMLGAHFMQRLTAMGNTIGGNREGTFKLPALFQAGTLDGWIDRL